MGEDNGISALDIIKICVKCKAKHENGTERLTFKDINPVDTKKSIIWKLNASVGLESLNFYYENELVNVSLNNPKQFLEEWLST